MSKPDHPETAIRTRPAELEDWLNRNLYHPLSFRLALLLRRTPITPNSVSISGGLMVILAGFFYYNSASVWGALLGFALHIAWHILDGADGDLARLTGQSSPLGEVIDGLCDYAGHVVLYLVLAAILAQQIGPIGWALMIAAGLARAVQTVFFETQRRQYQHWVYDTPWLRVSESKSGSGRGVLSALSRAYLRLGSALATNGSKLDASLSDLSEAQKEQMKLRIRAQMTPVMRSILVLSSNYRTLVIGTAMIAGAPLLIVGFELIVLSVVLWLSLKRSRRVIGGLLDQSGNSER